MTARATLRRFQAGLRGDAAELHKILCPLPTCHSGSVQVIIDMIMDHEKIQFTVCSFDSGNRVPVWFLVSTISWLSFIIQKTSHGYVRGFSVFAGVGDLGSTTAKTLPL